MGESGDFASYALPVLPPKGRALKERDGSYRGMTGREILFGATQILLVEI